MKKRRTVFGSGGKRSDINNTYFRSKWEANVARYLTFTNTPWEYEPRDFEFGVTRGVRFYKPDFRMTKLKMWIEVKGYLDSQGKTALARFKRWHPKEAAKLCGVVEKPLCKPHAAMLHMGYDKFWFYNEIKQKLSGLIPGWEN